jgi:DNA-directed RNA polymerase subunit omega
MEKVNENVEVGEEPVVNSRYTIVAATAKRARQIIDGADPLIKYQKGDKPLSIAVNELNDGAIKILNEEINN